METDRLSPDFAVDLSQNWEHTLSANQRAQLRQSRTFAARSGPLKLEPAAGTAQALDFFGKLAGLHTAYWQKRGRPGAFAMGPQQFLDDEILGDHEFLVDDREQSEPDGNQDNRGRNTI